MAMIGDTGAIGWPVSSTYDDMMAFVAVGWMIAV
jgi:hypothetical protein